ncbi:exported lactonase [Advenella kashmirensis WT001]|uniref:Exported lactonase n=1 Tax=Advenella kashmirensis (strain DSM 17095 / LMG 22695 / WT001) TaxID=1036672 RepID=I3U785_ADVKW|nr:lactonase family protein [Advenella kashmirensis]AFK60873.1 exported lactonase [Advenella kashmirensis WT001]
MYAYIGSRTTRDRHARGEGISIYQVNTDTGELIPVQVLKGMTNPSFLALNSSGTRLYAVHGDTSTVSSYTVDTNTGKLAPLNRQETGGMNPVHLALDPSECYLVISNHIGANLAVLPITRDGLLEPVSQLVSLIGMGEPGPHRIEQKHAKPHHNPFSVTGRHVLVPDKGLDRIFTYSFSDGQLSPVQPISVSSREGSGPRHIAFHPNANHAYCINELDSTVTTYRYHSLTGALQAEQILSTLPASFTGNNRAAEIIVDAAGRYVYATNRGHDSIAIFSIASNGLLSWAGCEKSGGRTPRFIALAPGGRHLYALNEDDDCICTFSVDPATGSLRNTGVSIHSGSPVCMIFST